MQAVAPPLEGAFPEPAAEPETAAVSAAAPAPVSGSVSGSASGSVSAPVSGSVSAPVSGSVPGPVPEDRSAAPSWTAGFLASGPSEVPVDLRAEALRFATGAGFAALYGVALGVRQGGPAILRHALGVPAALLAVAGLGVPALYILLALFDAPLEPSRVAAAASRAAASAGLLLAGLAPAAALFVVSSEGAGAAALAGAAGLILGGLAGVTRLLRELGRGFGGASEGARAASGIAFAGFALFATALAARVWWSTLPMLGGAL